MSMVGKMYPRVTENGNIAISYGETMRTLLACAAGNGVAIGEVKR